MYNIQLKHHILGHNNVSVFTHLLQIQGKKIIINVKICKDGIKKYIQTVGRDDIKVKVKYTDPNLYTSFSHQSATVV